MRTIKYGHCEERDWRSVADDEVRKILAQIDTLRDPIGGAYGS